MKAERIIYALGEVNEEFIEEAAMNNNEKKIRKIRWIAVAAVLLLLLCFLQTSVGVTAVNNIKEYISDFFETVFPSKNIVVMYEGITEEITHVADGREPEIQSDGTISDGGFAMYYDPERYEMSEENGVTYVRQIADNPTREQILANNEALFEGLTPEETEKEIERLIEQQNEFYSNLPACEIEIIQLRDIQPSAAAESIRTEMLESWDSVSEITSNEKPNGFYFAVSSGEDWDSSCEEIYFVSDGNNGTFQITARYFLEAAEGHGVRFRKMIETFSVFD